MHSFLSFARVQYLSDIWKDGRYGRSAPSEILKIRISLNHPSKEELFFNNKTPCAPPNCIYNCF